MMVLCLSPIRCFWGLDIPSSPLSCLGGDQVFQKIEMSLGSGGDLVGGRGWEAVLMFGETAACLVGSRELAVGKTRAGRRTPGQLQKEPAPSALAPGPFSFRSSPMEVQPPVSPQQSECNPVGALQVRRILVSHSCLPACLCLSPGLWRKLIGGGYPVLRAFPTHLPLLLL